VPALAGLSTVARPSLDGAAPPLVPLPPNLSEVDRASTAAAPNLGPARPATRGPLDSLLGTRDPSLRPDPRPPPGQSDHGVIGPGRPGAPGASGTDPGLGAAGSRIGQGAGGPPAGVGVIEAGPGDAGAPAPPPGGPRGLWALERATPRTRPRSSRG